MTPINIKSSSEEISLLNVLKTLIREKNLIILIVLISTFLSFIYSSKTKPIFSGNFSILVIDQNQKMGDDKSELIGLFSNKNISNDKDTQKLILKSPLVLMPVFNYVKNYQKESTSKLKNLKFKPWVRNHLIIDFEEGTDVLKVNYLDENRDLIFNVLNLLSKTYKNYSKDLTIKSLEEREKYLEAQKINLSDKLNISKKEYNKFAIDNGLGNLDGFVSLGKDIGTSKKYQLKTELETEFKNIEKSLTPAKNNNTAGQRFQRQFELLELYESDFVDLSSKLKPNSRTLKNLKIQIENLKESLKRPNEILIKYDELYKTYMRNENLLNSVEDKLALVEIEQIKTLRTWDVISPTTVGNEPIHPKKSQIFFITLIFSSIFGSFIALIKEKLSNLVFPIEDFERQLNCKYIDNLSKKENKLSFFQILDKFESNSRKDKNIFGIINFKNKVDLTFIKEFIDSKENIKVNDFSDLSFIKECEQMILIIESGKYTFEEIETINKYITFSKEKVVGWFFIKD